MWQARQQPNPIRGPSCHMSSFRQQEMDVLHFTAHNICRGNHSTPQRACAAVLKLSIVLAVMSLAFSSDLPGARELRGWRFVLKSPLPLSWNIAPLHSGCLSQLSQKLGEMAMTWQGIEVKICQNKKQELVAFLKRNGAFSSLPLGFGLYWSSCLSMNITLILLCCFSVLVTVDLLQTTENMKLFEQPPSER